MSNLIESLVARDIRNAQLTLEQAQIDRKEIGNLRGVSTHRAIDQLDFQIPVLQGKLDALRGVGAYLAGMRNIVGPHCVETWLDAVWAEETTPHQPAELIGGRIPAHVPGAYPNLSCCGGTIQLVDVPAVAVEEASRG